MGADKGLHLVLHILTLYLLSSGTRPATISVADSVHKRFPLVIVIAAFRLHVIGHTPQQSF